MSTKQGLLSEQQALNYLLKQKLTWVVSNYRCRLGEIDLIMQDKDYLVFVEVRARKNSSFGKAAETITHAKQIKIIKAANFYLTYNKLHHLKIRFDVIAMDGKTIEWIKNAFVSE